MGILEQLDSSTMDNKVHIGADSVPTWLRDQKLVSASCTHGLVLTLDHSRENVLGHARRREDGDGLGREKET